MERSGAQWSVPVYRLEQHGELRLADQHLPLCRRGPHEASLLEAFAEQAGALAIPPDDLDQIAPSAAEHEQMAAEGILFEHLLGKRAETVIALAHIGDPGREPDARPRRNRDHAAFRSARVQDVSEKSACASCCVIFAHRD